MASRSESFFPASGCVPEQGEWISQCAAIWIRGIKMNVTGEHTHYVSVSHVHFYGEWEARRTRDINSPCAGTHPEAGKNLSVREATLTLLRV